MGFAQLLVLSAAAVEIASAQSPDLASRLSSGGDRTSLIFAAPGSPEPATTTGGTPVGTGPTTTTPAYNYSALPIYGPNGTLVFPTLNPIGTNGTHLPTLLNLTRPAPSNGTFVVLPTLPSTPNLNFSTGLPFFPTFAPLNWTFPGLNLTHNGTLVFPTLPTNFSVPSFNFTHPNGTSFFPTFPPMNWTFPGLNLTQNGTLVFPTLPTNFSVPSNFTVFPHTNGTLIFPTLPPMNWTIPGFNITPTLFPNFPIPSLNTTRLPLFGTTPVPGTSNGTFVFPTFPPLNWTIFPGQTMAPPNNSSLPWFGTTSTPRPVGTANGTTTNFWSSSTRAPILNGSTRFPFGTWTPPVWTGWNGTVRPGTVNGTLSTTTRPGTINGTLSTTTRPGTVNGTLSTTTRPGTINGTLSTTTRPGTFNGTSTPSPVAADVPGSLQDLLKNWRARFAADMEAVRFNISQYLLH